MELYGKTSYELSKKLTTRYSTSFSMSSTLFSPSIRPHIYAIYGLVRIADEIVDSYREKDADKQLEKLQRDTHQARKSGFSSNPILHAFATTARHFSIDETLIDPFFESMKTDLTATHFTQEEYDQYIYGSAEVVGLMCLKIFTDADTYHQLEDGAKALGSAYQKINFLRDIRADHDELGRVYFPSVSFEKFNNRAKSAIIKDVRNDLAKAQPALRQLPPSARKAVYASYLYYTALLDTIEKTPTSTLVSRRVRVPRARKLQLLLKARIS
ncbi:phytoene/squalene synthase family protein [Candidatus Saccharibacteria bacterium]|nr:phytoene/squalene synthase family protein [Candidatus Saccharibacteria bacterium]